MSGPPEPSTLPTFVAEIDRLSDELELFGYPRMLPPEFTSVVHLDGRRAEIGSVKVLDLLNALMDSLWTLIQSKHQDRELRGDEGDIVLKLGCEFKTLETDFHKLQIKLKKKNHELSVLSREVTASMGRQAELSARSRGLEETIRSLRSQLRQSQRSTGARLAAKDFELAKLRERLKQGRSGTDHTLREVREQEMLLKKALLSYQHTNDILVSDNLTLQRELKRAANRT